MPVHISSFSSDPSAHCLIPSQNWSAGMEISLSSQNLVRQLKISNNENYLVTYQLKWRKIKNESVSHTVPLHIFELEEIFWIIFVLALNISILLRTIIYGLYFPFRIKSWIVPTTELSFRNFSTDIIILDGGCLITASGPIRSNPISISSKVPIGISIFVTVISIIIIAVPFWFLKLAKEYSGHFGVQYVTLHSRFSRINFFFYKVHEINMCKNMCKRSACISDILKSR